MPVLERRRPGQRRQERRVVDDDDAPDFDLPPYEALACPLTNEAKRAIADLSNSRDVHRYNNHINTSVQHLSDSIMGINDILRESRDSVRRMAEKRAEHGIDEKPAREVQTEAHVKLLEAEVPTLNVEIEAALRDLIDRRVQLADEKTALAETVDYFQRLPIAPAGRRRRARESGEGEDGADEDDEDDEPIPPEHTVIDTLRQHKADRSHEYDNLNAYQRYALNNDYAAFKKLWHDAANGDTGAPLPNAKRWFDDAGNPVLPATDSHDVKNSVGAEDDDDEDLVIAGEVRDFRCPLSMTLYKEPYSNHVCNHTYEKQWVVDMLQRAPNGRAVCVVAGCSKEFGLDDFYADNLILRKMERAQRLAEEQGSSSAEEDGDDDAPQQVKREGKTNGRKRKVETIDDEE